MHNGFIKKIVSGGQTGVDRAALDVAIALNIPHGGWCPKKRKAEDGAIPLHYQLQETPSIYYKVRTTWNVRDSDGTLIFIQGPPKGGTLLTITMAQNLKKPFLVFDILENKQMETIIDWIKANQINVLNIAGPRESQKPGIYDLAYRMLHQLLHL